jgi:hypothetical protein
LRSGSEEAEGSEEAMRDGDRFALGFLCGAFALIVGGLALVGSIIELIQGQAHGPSIVFMSALILPFVVGAGWVAWRMLR